MDTNYNPYARYQTQFTIYGSPSQNHTVGELQNGILKELDDLKKYLVSDKELQRIKNQIIAQKTFEKDSIFGQATELGLLETIGIGWQKADEYTKAINAITPQQVQQTAQDYFQEKSRTIAILEPQPQRAAP